MTELMLLTAAWTVKETITFVVAVLISSAFAFFLVNEGRKEEPLIFEKGIILSLLLVGFVYVFNRILY